MIPVVITMEDNMIKQHLQDEIDGIRSDILVLKQYGADTSVAEKRIFELENEIKRRETAFHEKICEYYGIVH